MGHRRIRRIAHPTEATLESLPSMGEAVDGVVDVEEGVEWGVEEVSRKVGAVVVRRHNFGLVCITPSCSCHISPFHSFHVYSKDLQLPKVRMKLVFSSGLR